MKICKKCGKEKPLVDFASHQQTRDRLRPWCRQCVSEYEKERRTKNPEAWSERCRTFTLKKYSLTIDEYNERLENQRGVCAVCGGENNGKTFHVDHDHKTGIVRGLLCSSCNMALGLLKDDSSIILRMFDYLEDNEGLPFWSLESNSRVLCSTVTAPKEG